MPWVGGGLLLSAYLASQKGSGGGGGSSPLPTYYQEYQSPQQQSVWNMMMYGSPGGGQPSGGMPGGMPGGGGGSNYGSDFWAPQGNPAGPTTLGGMGGMANDKWGGKAGGGLYDIGGGGMPQGTGPLQNLFGGNMPTPTPATMGGAPSFNPVAPGQAPTPTAGWYSGLDSNVRAGIEEPYMRGMDMLRNQLGGGGMLGNPGAGISGAAADVFGDYASKAAPAMANTAWGMMAPGLLAKQGQEYGAGLQAQGLGAQGLFQQLGAQNTANLMGQGQGWEAQMMPYNMLPSMLPQTYSDLLVGHHPHIGPAGTPYQNPFQNPPPQNPFGNYVAPYPDYDFGGADAGDPDAAPDVFGGGGIGPGSLT